MPDSAAITPPPRAASKVVLRHDENGPHETSISLETIAARLPQRPPDGIGLGSRVWRFAPLAMAQERPERPDDFFYALKWVNLDDPVRAQHLPRELGWLRRLERGYFPSGIAQAMLRADTYLLVTEWVEGRNLALHAPQVVAELIAAKTFKRFCGDVIRIGEQLKKAGMVHGDIWEPNIIVRDLRPVLIDFGWARENGQAPARDNFHQPDDDRAIHQMLLRLGALRRMVTPRQPPAGVAPATAM